MKEAVYIALDIGGTWLKAAAFSSFDELPCAGPKVCRAPSLLPAGDAALFAERVIALIQFAAGARRISGIGIACPGLVDPQGTRVTHCATHLRPLDDPAWVTKVNERFKVGCVLINDAQAGLCGAAESGLLPASGTVGFMAVGTGLGFVIWKNGKLWNPGRKLPLLGSVRTPAGSYDEIASVTRIASSHASGEASSWLVDPSCAEGRSRYLCNLKGIIATAAILYQLDRVILGGGLASAAHAVGFPLARSVADALGDFPELSGFPVVECASEGNALNLLGAVALAKGCSLAPPPELPSRSTATESALAKDLRLELLGTEEILELMHAAECQAITGLEDSLIRMAPLVDDIARRMEEGGRLIYLGAGTSGRLAALDAVELPCTFGCAPGEAIALIAGGSPEASDTIESENEEDASSVPDLLLVQPGPLDIVIGISASGSAFYVRSGLAFAEARGAKCVLIREAAAAGGKGETSVIALKSGPEVVQGSTRLKAGTATKRVLNALSTAVMIRRGKVRGTSMIDLQCLNEKLRGRAVRILRDLHGTSEEDALEILGRSGWDLRTAIHQLENKAVDVFSMGNAHYPEPMKHFLA